MSGVERPVGAEAPCATLASHGTAAAQGARAALFALMSAEEFIQVAPETMSAHRTNRGAMRQLKYVDNLYARLF
jgi:hypothetical protein